jgi:hypothetical protein
MKHNRVFVAVFSALPLCGLLVLLAARAGVGARIADAWLRRDLAATEPPRRASLERSAREMEEVARRFSERPYGTYRDEYEYLRRRSGIDDQHRR